MSVPRIKYEGNFANQPGESCQDRLNDASLKFRNEKQSVVVTETAVVLYEGGNEAGEGGKEGYKVRWVINKPADIVFRFWP